VVHHRPGPGRRRRHAGMIELLSAGVSSATAILDADARASITYDELRDRVAAAADVLRREVGGQLVVLAASNVPSSIIAYLACLEAGCPVVLVEPTLDSIESIG